MEGGVNTAVGLNFRQQTFSVGRAQLLNLTEAKQRANELGPFIVQFLQRGRIGAVASFGLLPRCQAMFGVQNFAQLSG